MDPLLSLPALVLSRPGLLRQSLPLRGTWCHIDDDHGVGVLVTFLGGGEAQTWCIAHGSYDPASERNLLAEHLCIFGTCL